MPGQRMRATLAAAAAVTVALVDAVPAAPYEQYFARKFADHKDAALNDAADEWAKSMVGGASSMVKPAVAPLVFTKKVVSKRAAFWSNDEQRTHALKQTYLNVPTLTLKGKSFVHVARRALGQYRDPGAKCVDFDPQGKLESFGTLTTTGRVDLTKDGEYKIFYDCRSSVHPNYNAASAMRVVVVGGKDPYHNAAGLPSACAVGQYAETQDAGGVRRVRCSLCAPGRFGDSEGANSCTACPTGKYQLRPGQNTCKINNCLPGKYLDLPTEGCQPCPANTYSGYKALGGCTACGQNKMGEQRYRFGQGGRFPSSCASSKCMPGTFQREGRCDPCPINSYQPFWGQLHCLDCPKGMRTATVSGNVKCVTHEDMLTSKEVLEKYLKPRTCSDISCSITQKRVYTSTQHRWPSLDRKHKYPEVGHRIVVHHGKEGGKLLGHNQVNELHGVHHRCAMHDNYQKCTCFCWYTPPKYDQWSAVRTKHDELYWSRAERVKRGEWERKEAGEYVHTAVRGKRTLLTNLCTATNGICNQDLKHVFSDHTPAGSHWTKQADLATSWKPEARV